MKTNKCKKSCLLIGFLSLLMLSIVSYGGNNNVKGSGGSSHGQHHKEKEKEKEKEDGSSSESKDDSDEAFYKHLKKGAAIMPGRKFKLFLRYNIILGNTSFLPQKKNKRKKFLHKLTRDTAIVLNRGLGKLGSKDRFEIDSNSNQPRIINGQSEPEILQLSEEGKAVFKEGPSTRALLMHEYLNYGPHLTSTKLVDIYLTENYIANPETAAVTYRSGEQEPNILDILNANNVDMRANEHFRELFGVEFNPQIAREFIRLPMIIVGISDEAFREATIPHELMHIFWSYEHTDDENNLMYGGVLNKQSWRITGEQHQAIRAYFES